MQTKLGSKNISSERQHKTMLIVSNNKRIQRHDKEHEDKNRIGLQIIWATFADYNQQITNRYPNLDQPSVIDTHAINSSTVVSKISYSKDPLKTRTWFQKGHQKISLFAQETRCPICKFILRKYNFWIEIMVGKWIQRAERS